MKSPHTSRRERHGNPSLRERVHDPYHDRMKTGGATRCEDCGAVYLDGRWTWQQIDAVASTVCPACRRIRDHVPAGELVLGIPADDPRLDAILHRVDNLAEAEKREHPLHRIILVDRGEAQTVVTTTDLHQPHRFGHAVKDAWGGRVETHYDPAGYFARVVWHTT